MSKVSQPLITVSKADVSCSDAQLMFDALHKHAISNTMPTCCIVEAIVACNKCCVICQLWLTFQNLHRTVELEISARCSI